MEKDDLIMILRELTELPAETEWVEFKLNKGSVSNQQIGKYIPMLN